MSAVAALKAALASGGGNSSKASAMRDTAGLLLYGDGENLAEQVCPVVTFEMEVLTLPLKACSRD